MQYKYRKIDLEQFAVLADGPIADDSSLNLRTELGFAYDKENRMLANTMTITVNNGNDVIMKAVMTSYFEISEETVAEVTREDGHILFDPMSLVQFASLNYGSLRGAIYIKAADTPLKDLVIPPVYFHKIITTAFEVD